MTLPLTEPVRPAGQLLTAVLAWCLEYPWDGDDLAPGDITFQQHFDGEARTVSILGDVPDVMAVSTMLLADGYTDPELVSFDRGVLTLNVQPAKLLYRALYFSWDATYVMFRRMCPRCHGSRKVPNWSDWNEEYGEPRPKPCPECAEWPR